jgi:hypothetical protein
MKIKAQFIKPFEPGTGGSHLLILATQEADIRRIAVQSQPRQIVCKTLSRKTLSQKGGGGMVEWFKVKALSSSPRTSKTKQNKKEIQKLTI